MKLVVRIIHWYIPALWHIRSNYLVCFRGKKWGLDFWDNTDVVRTAYGQYSTELFSARAEKIIAEHDISKVSRSELHVLAILLC